MKANSLIRLSFAVMAIATLASCKKSNKEGRLVPKDALFVMTTNSQSLLSKISPQEWIQNPIVQEILKDSTTSSALRSMLLHPDSSGVDITANGVMFVQKDSLGMYLAFEGMLKDTGLYSNYIKQVIPNSSETQKDGLTLISGSRRNIPMCVGWKENKFVYISQLPDSQNPYQGFALKDSTTANNGKAASICQSIFALDESNSLAKDEKFTKLVKETGDVHAWVNIAKIFDAVSSTYGGALSLLNIQDLFKDRISTFTVSFDNGKIDVTSRSYMSDKLLSWYKNTVGDKINEDMVQRIRGKEATGAFAINFKPQGILDLCKLFNVDGMANSQLGRYNLTLDDIVQAFKGDIVFGATDFNVEMDSTGDEPYRYATPNPKGNFVFALSIGDKKEFDKVFSVIKTMAAQGAPDTSVSYDNNDSFFVITNSKAATAKYLAGGNNNYPFINRMNGEPIGTYVNIQAILNGCSTEIPKDSITQSIYNLSLNFWKDLSMKGGSIHDDSYTGSFEINLVNDTTNSLKQLNQYFGQLFLLAKEKKKQEQAQWMNDTSALPSPSVDSVVTTPATPGY
jgi:uncharacterized protein DUF4836